MQIELIIDFSKVIVPLLGGVLFVLSYFFAEKNEFFHFLAYFPRKREGSVKVGALIFGIVFIIVAFYNFLVTF